MTAASIEVSLPCGFWHEGRRYGDAALSPLSAQTEAEIAGLSDVSSPAEKVTLLLAHAVTRLGPFEPVRPDHVRCLTPGDREALLLRLRGIMFGESMRCLLACPISRCGESLELNLATSELLVPPYDHAEPWHEIETDADGERVVVRFRLPDGAALERASRAAKREPRSAAEELVRDCIESVRRTGGGLVDAPRGAVLTAVADAIAERDPQAEIVLDLTCPACGECFTSLLDAASIVLAEISERSRRVAREVHQIAWHYHWTERDILALPAERRRRYLELISEALTEEAGR